MMFLIIIAIVVLIVLYIITTINKFTRFEIKVDEALSGIEITLEKRYDTLTKLLDATKGYLKHEENVFKEVINLRQGMMVNDLQKADNQMNDMAKNIFAIAENYPELKSSEVFVELEEGIKDAEEHLQAARRIYNANVTAYNTAIAIFPNRLLKGSREPKEFYETESYKREDVKMTF